MKPTPVMSQYLRLKEQVGDAILFFRMGDFYEMFFQDAVEAAALLDLTLTSRDKQQPDPIPMAGVPWHSAGPYVARLLKSGRRVAICEQVDRPETRGLMDREIVEILTPGTAVGEELLEDAQNLYLAAIAKERERYGLAVADISTGEFTLGEFNAGELFVELARQLPKELLLPAPLSEQSDVRAFLREHPGLFITRHDEWLFSPSRGETLLREQYGVASLEPFGISGMAAAHAAAGALLSYAREQRRAPLGHLRPPRLLRDGECVLVDETTLRNLEILSPVSGTGRQCLLGILDATRTAMGLRALRRALARPLADATAIRARHAAVQTLVDAPERLEALRTLLRGLADVERIIGRLHCGKVRPQDLGRLRDALAVTPRMLVHAQALAAGGDFPHATGLDACEALGGELERALVETPRLAAGTDTIRAGYDEELDRLRLTAEEGEEWLARLQEDERRVTGIPSLKVAYNRVFGYYIEVTRAQLSRVPAHYERKQTIAGAERFITPELKAWEERIASAREGALARQAVLRQALEERARADTPRLQALAVAIGEWDLLACFAQRAIEFDYRCPLIEEGDSLSIRDGRHAVVERFLDAGTFVANDIELDTRQRQIQIITGPNMAGKSTFLRQVGLLVLMAQAGSFVPAAEARIGLVDRIFTRVGAGDAIAQGRSTFLVEMIETSRILYGATARSLVLLDEIGRGTSTFDGLAIAWAVAEYLRQDPLRRPRTLFATHFHELTGLARRELGYVNLTVLVKEWKDRVIFVRRVVEGSADRSYGIQVARLAGLPEPLLGRAREILHILEEHGPDHLDGMGAAGGEPQMSLFGAAAGGDEAEAPPAFIDEGGAHGALAELGQALQRLDLEGMTGLEALLWINDWKRQLREPMARDESARAGKPEVEMRRAQQGE
jgi:DNA mismatch repair protein MutS